MRLLSLAIACAFVTALGCARPPTPANEPVAHTERTAEVIAQASSPGESHRLLSQLAGDWNYTVSMWMDPDAKPQVLEGKSKNTMNFGDRHLVQEYWGELMGQPFNGQAITSFDNVRQEFSTAYIDNMSTGMMVSRGAYDPATRSITETGTFSCPITGQKNVPARSVLTFVDADHYDYASFTTDASGKEVKLMDIKFTRAQGSCCQKGKAHTCPHSGKKDCSCSSAKAGSCGGGCEKAKGCKGH